MMALLCLAFVGCKEPEPETWTKITTFKGLDGTWECKADMVESDMPAIEGVTVSGVGYLKIDGDNISTKSSMVVDFTAMIDQVATASGMSADEYWASFKESMEEGMTCSEGRPYTMSEVTEWELVDEAEAFGDGEVYVNNKKTKIKAVSLYPKYDEETGDEILDDSGKPVMEKVEMIFVKK